MKLDLAVLVKSIFFLLDKAHIFNRIVYLLRELAQNLAFILLQKLMFDQ